MTPGQPADFDPSPLLGVFEDTINRLHKLKVEVARDIVELEGHVVSDGTLRATDVVAVVGC